MIIGNITIHNSYIYKYIYIYIYIYIYLYENYKHIYIYKFGPPTFEINARPLYIVNDDPVWLAGHDLSRALILFCGKQNVAGG